MNPRDLVDPELLPLLDHQPDIVLDAASLLGARTALPELFTGGQQPDLALASLVVHQAGQVPVRVFTPIGGPEDTKHPVLLHIHGGGMVMGTAAMMDVQHARLAAELGCVIASVEYRLAPENPFPAAIEDCYEALRWLHRHAAALAVDPTRIAVGGESAGGGLAASLALMARDRGEVPIVFQHLIYPMLDDRTALTVEPGPHAGHFVWTREKNRFGWRALLGNAAGGPDTSPYAAAARAADLSGLPPAFISVGALDLFIDEDIEYARRLITAGVPCELHVFPGAYHGFDSAPQVRSAMVARNRSRAALRRALHPG
ncbi:alpha/beta hydrolase [Rhizosaccharibacter radicis]|uniref:Alpha/beta hydrolase n=1 Tax=Rhizosaccharibacter radicis TaxID=2782605 RepID=A0ABT1W189_9PROT|nr:alpha/beta hydrolase [Acetobacteraceae bacterium KSS12]